MNSTFWCLTGVFTSVHKPLSASATLTNFASLKNSFKSPFDTTDISCSFKYSFNGAFKCLHFYSHSTLRFTVWSRHTKRIDNVFSAISNSTSHYFCLHVCRTFPSFQLHIFTLARFIYNRNTKQTSLFVKSFSFHPLWCLPFMQSTCCWIF